MRNIQLPLFASETVSQEPRKRASRPTCYYIIKRMKDNDGSMVEFMVSDVDQHGKPIWALHDTQHMDPYVFSTSGNARKWMKAWGGHNVRSTCYSHLVRIAPRR